MADNILEVRLEETRSELSLVREAFKRAMDKLSEAENALKFYADPRSFKVSRREEPGNVFQDLVLDDFEGADNDKRTLVAGRRARTYFRTYSS